MHALLAAGTIEPGHQHVDAVAQADQKTCEQGNEDAGGPHRTQGCGACKPPDHRNVGHIEQHLQQVGQGQRQADQQDLPRQRPLGKGHFLGAHSLFLYSFPHKQPGLRTPQTKLYYIAYFIVCKMVFSAGEISF